MSEKSEITLSFETLYELLRLEKQREQIQKVSENFYEEVVEYLKQKQQELDETSGKVDLFAATQKAKQRTQMHNLMNLLTELYGRREKKLMMMALNKARTGSDIVDTHNLLPEEKQLLDSMIQVLETFREGILSSIFQGQAPKVSENILSKTGQGQLQQPERTESPENGGKEQQGTGRADTGQQQTQTPEESPQEEPAREDSEEESEESTSEDDSQPQQDMKMVRFLQPVPKFVGTELEVYGPFEPEDIANLPADIADVLIRKERAEEMSDQGPGAS